MKAVKKQFEVGDKVVLTSRGVQGCEGKDWTLGGSNPDKYKVEFGTEYEVVRSFKTGEKGREFPYLELKGMLFSHPQSKFALSPDAVVIVLRRPVDRKSIEKYLFDKGYMYDKHSHAEYQESAKEASRVIAVHLNGKWKDQLTYNDPMTFDIGASFATDETLKFIKPYFNHKEVRVIKTKPSVSQAIVELDKFI